MQWWWAAGGWRQTVARVTGSWLVPGVVFACLAAVHPRIAAGALGQLRGDGFAAVAEIELPSSLGPARSLADDPAAFRVVCFLGTECPLVRLYGPRLDELARRFAERGVSFVGINANPQDSLEEVAEYGRSTRLTNRSSARSSLRKCHWPG